MADPSPLLGAQDWRVLEVGTRLGVAAAGLALAAMGAEVVQARLRGRYLAPEDATYYDRGRLVVEGDTDLSALGRTADVVLTDLAPDGLGALGLPTDEAGLAGGEDPQVLVSIRSLGRDGPHAGFRMTDLTEWAAGGLANVTRRPHRDDPERYVPVVPPGCQPQALAGIAAAIGAFAGRRSARAQRAGVVVDVSVQEVVAATLHSVVPNFVWNLHVLGHPSWPTTSMGFLLPASDGDVYIRTVEAHQWDKVVAWVDDPALHAIGATPEERMANRDVIVMVLSQWSSSQRRNDLLEEGQRRKVPIALPRSIDDVLAWQQLRARGAWCTVEHCGTPAVVPRIPMLEPPTWRTTRATTVAEVADVWGSR
jgi:crotonobetainyl-CoA:carnitine CoA-transferase CaiB-like acyl-CoA transferase